MRHWLVHAVILMPACAFDGSGIPGLDADQSVPGVDGSSATDALSTDGTTGPDALPLDGAVAQWTLVDTITVPTNGTTTPSSITLVLGETYRLRASGTFVVSTAGALADAEYWDFPSMLDGVSGVDLGIAIDDPVVDTNRTPKWGTYDPSHVYQVDFVGKGAVIDAGYHDGNFSNNMGTLTLDVFRFQ